jgi:hypothetical protein
MRNRIVQVVATVLLVSGVVGCASAAEGGAQQQDSEEQQAPDPGPSAVQLAAAQATCDEAVRQLSTLSGGTEVLLLQCEALSNGADDVALVFGLNDWMEWTTLISTQSLEDVIFTLPLSLVAYAFGGSNEAPETFDRIIVVFRDDSQTVYDIDPRDLRTALSAQTLEEAQTAILALREKLTITSLG